MWGTGEWRDRARREHELRRECRELRYILVNWDLQPKSLGQLESLLRRVDAAQSALRAVVYAHDDSPNRWAKFGIGVVATGIGLVGISTANPLGLVGAGLGIALILDESRGLIGTKVVLQQDQDLLEALSRLQRRIMDELQARGIRTPPRF